MRHITNPNFYMERDNDGWTIFDPLERKIGHSKVEPILSTVKEEIAKGITTTKKLFTFPHDGFKVVVDQDQLQIVEPADLDEKKSSYDALLFYHQSFPRPCGLSQSKEVNMPIEVILTGGKHLIAPCPEIWPDTIQVVVIAAVKEDYTLVLVPKSASTGLND